MFIEEKQSKLDSARIKLLLMEYFRYKKQFFGVVSEYQHYCDEVEDFVAFKNYEIAYEGYFSLSDYGRLLKVIKKPYCIFGSAKSDILELLSLVEEKEQIKGFCVYEESFTKMNQSAKDRDYLIYNF